MSLLELMGWIRLLGSAERWVDVFDDGLMIGVPGVLTGCGFHS